LIEEAGKSQDSPLPDWLEDQVWQQKMCSSRAAITNTDKQNPPNSAAIFFFLSFFLSFFLWAPGS
jgi:hypothetical protein